MLFLRRIIRAANLPHSTPLARGAPPHVRYQSQSKKRSWAALYVLSFGPRQPLQWGHRRRIFNFIQHAHTQTSTSWLVKHWPIFGPPWGRAMLLVRSVNLHPLPRKALLASSKTNISGHQKKTFPTHRYSRIESFPHSLGGAFDEYANSFDLKKTCVRCR
jgi:hypothetical protein